MARPKGLPKTGGRKKGTPNKLTKAVKDALGEAFDEMGGTASLVKWGKANPGEFYKLWGRLIPVEANLKHSGNIGLEALVAGAGEDD